MPSKGKVLFTSHTANFQKFNRPFMQMLRDQGCEVHYASMGEEEILDCDKSFVVSFTRNPLKLSNVTAYRQLKKIIDRENYDIIHTHTPMGSVVTRLAARGARRRGTKVIYTAHGFHFFKGAPLLNWLVYYPIELAMAHLTDMLITINSEDYSRAKQHFATNVAYVPGVGVDPKKFDIVLSRATRDKIRAQLGLAPDDFVLIYVAELSKRKNQKWLLRTLRDTLQQHTRMHLLLVGADSMNGSLQKITKEYSLDRQVHFLGYRNDIPELLKVADLYVSSSTQEGLPVNILEAVISRLPIVALDCRGCAELLSLVGDKPVRRAVDFQSAVEWHEQHHLAAVDYDTSAVYQYTLSAIINEMKHFYQITRDEDRV